MTRGFEGMEHLRPSYEEEMTYFTFQEFVGIKLRSELAAALEMNSFYIESTPGNNNAFWELMYSRQADADQAYQVVKAREEWVSQLINTWYQDKTTKEIQQQGVGK